MWPFCNLISHCIGVGQTGMKIFVLLSFIETYPEGMIERDAISLFPFRWKLSLFFSLLQFFLQVSCLCLLLSQKAEVNCLAGEQTAVAITGSETENARMLIGQRKQSTVVITGSGVKIDCVQLIKIILKTLHIQSRTSSTSFQFWEFCHFHHHHLLYYHHVEAITVCSKLFWSNFLFFLSENL